MKHQPQQLRAFDRIKHLFQGAAPLMGSWNTYFRLAFDLPLTHKSGLVATLFRNDS